VPGAEFGCLIVTAGGGEAEDLDLGVGPLVGILWHHALDPRTLGQDRSASALHECQVLTSPNLGIP
jgi:hypothetical protein